MSPSYDIAIDGCDDTTRFTMELREDEAAVVEKLSAASVEASEYGCQPILQITLQEDRE